MEKKYRLITRNDFDGLACAILLKKLDLIEDILFVHPRDMQHGRVPVTIQDISVNLPYVTGIYMAFDHHESETKRIGDTRKNFICDSKSPSAARVIYDYFHLDEKFPGEFEELLAAVDKADTADFTKEEILSPTGWVLFNFIIDPKTGFYRFHDFQKNHNELVSYLIDNWEGKSIDEILNLPDMQERIHFYETYRQHFIDQINRCAFVCQNLVTVDLREEEILYPGNRFMVYALYPHCDLSLLIQKDTQSDRITFSAGKSILKTTCPLDVGELMLKYHGGGHAGAGTCQSADFDVEKIKTDLIADILLGYQESKNENTHGHSRVSSKKNISPCGNPHS